MALALTVMPTSGPVGGGSKRPSVFAVEAVWAAPQRWHQVLLSLVAQQEAAQALKGLGVILAAPLLWGLPVCDLLPTHS